MFLKQTQLFLILYTLKRQTQYLFNKKRNKVFFRIILELSAIAKNLKYIFTLNRCSALNTMGTYVHTYVYNSLARIHFTWVYTKKKRLIKATLTKWAVNECNGHFNVSSDANKPVAPIKQIQKAILKAQSNNAKCALALRREPFAFDKAALINSLVCVYKLKGCKSIIHVNILTSCMFTRSYARLISFFWNVNGGIWKKFHLLNREYY